MPEVLSVDHSCSENTPAFRALQQAGNVARHEAAEGGAALAAPALSG